MEAKPSRGEKKLSLGEIRSETAEAVSEFEELVAADPDLPWLAEFLPFLRELQELANNSPLDENRCADFKVRVTAHIREKRLKGLDFPITHAAALEEMAEASGIKGGRVRLSRSNSVKRQPDF